MAQPERIGPYRITGTLGQGGMGTVYEAWDDRLDRRVAIKYILPEKTGSAQARRRFRREARAIAGLSHPAIVQIYDILDTDRGDAIVLERVEGRTLRERMQQGPLALAEAVRIARQIAAGLAEAHRRGIVHRDLKAANVMIAGEPPRAKILDFGLAKPLRSESDELSRSGAVLGSFLAMSPEQARGRAVDHRSDLFSLGSLLYEMVTGRAPFAADSVAQVIVNICALRQAPASELRPGAPAELSGLIDRLLEKDPARRPQDAGQVARDLERLALGPEERPPPEDRGAQRGAAAEAGRAPAATIEDLAARLHDQPTLDDSSSAGLRARARATLLERVERFWIDEVLETAVPAGGPLRLPERPAPERVVRPWGVGEAAARPSRESALAWFADQGHAVLILGEPGAGKSFRLLQLAREAIAAARDDLAAPLPVVLPLASWTSDRGSMSRWIGEELNLRYHIPRSVADRWIEDGSLLLLLDGLDEVAAGERAACVAAFNRLRREAGLARVAVTCRSTAYRELEKAGHRLALYSAAELRPLTADQVDQQLRSAGDEPDRAAPGPELRELLSNPLMLSVFLDGAWATPDPQQSAEDLRRRVLAGYVRRLLDRPLAPDSTYSPARITAWLGSLARGLLDSRQAVFQIERLQPGWLTAAGRRSYLLLSRLLLAAAVGGLCTVMAAVAPPDIPPLETPIATVLAGLAVAGLDGRRFRRPAPAGPPTARQRTGRFLKVALAAAVANLAVQSFLARFHPGFLIFAFVFGWLLGWKSGGAGYGDDVQPVAALGWSWRTAGKGLAVGTVLGLLKGLGMAVGRGRPLTPEVLFEEWLGPVMFLGAMGAVVGGLKETLAGDPLRPNYGTWISLRTALVGGGSLFAVLMFVALGIFGPLEPWLTDASMHPNFILRPLDFEKGWSRALPLAFFIGSFGVLSYGILEVIKHYTLRFMLWWSGCLPLRIAPFLAAAADLGLLRLGAGGAVFRHRLLLEHFAGEPVGGDGKPQKKDGDRWYRVTGNR